MSQKLISNIKDRITYCYENVDFVWLTKGNIIQVMRNQDFQTFVFENCQQVAPIFKNHFGNDVFIDLERNSFDDAYLSASRIIEANTVITINPFRELNLDNETPSWLDDAKIQELGWGLKVDEGIIGYKISTYRTRYFEYLEKVKGWKPDVLEEVKRSSLKVVKNVGNPNDANAFFVKGMVLGSVQSGKTTNFNAVINSAIDLGYQLIIVFCGTIEDLRRQTYARISTDVVGGWNNNPRDVGDNFIGVSKIYNFHAGERQVNLITGPGDQGDFTSNIAAVNFNPNAYNIAVCKKNVSIIKNLLLWLGQYQQAINLPTLIIDDECDNASLNNNGHDADANPSQINAGIRALLNMFHKKTYLGYTATPFANILQFNENEVVKFSWTTNGQNNEFDCCDENLFPDNFIHLLSPPSNYVGIKDFFDTRDPNKEKISGLIEYIPLQDIVECFPLRVIVQPDRTIRGTDSTERGTRSSKKDDPFPTYLPDSLKDAIKCFILSIALRYSRKKEQESFPLAQKHHSMLIHVSRYKQWIDRTKKLVEDYINEINNKIRNGNLESDIYMEFKRIWNIYFLTQINDIRSQLNEIQRGDPFLTPKDFDTVRNYLPTAVRDIDIKAIRSGNNEKLEYNDSAGNKYIAIGGNALSRGFTLEGLTISYFIRGTSNADTLMQMGRWFGYRPGYLDGCKLFTSRDAIRKFDEASLIIEDLENKLDEMIKDRKSPKEFTIWVQDNPDVIRLTRPNLLRNLHSLVLDFNDKLQQSTQFLINKDKIDRYYVNFKKYIKSINTDWEEKGSFILKRDVTSKTIIEALSIDGLKDVLVNLNIAGLDNFIQKANIDNCLNNWTIAISLTRGGDNKSIDLRNEFGIDLMSDAKLIQRSRANGDERSLQLLFEENIFKAIKSTIISPSDLGIAFDDEKKKTIENTFLSENPDKRTVPESAYRKKLKPESGILIFYMIDPSYIIGQPEFISEKYKKSYEGFIERNALTDFKTPIVGCAVGLPKLDGDTTYKYVTRQLIKIPAEMTYNELLVASGNVGTRIREAIDLNTVLGIKEELKMELEFTDFTDLRELKISLLINYLEN